MFAILPIAALGLAAGMLVNYLSDVLPIYRTLHAPVCTNCGRPYPFANYFLWPRHCSHCMKRRSARTWLVEVLYIALFVWLWTDPLATSILPFWPAALIWVYFGVVVVIDAELRLILHPVSLAGAGLGLALGGYLHGFWGSLAGGLAGYVILLTLYGLGSLFMRLTRRWQEDADDVALGYGDVNLAGVLGLLLGWPNILLGLTLSIVLAGFLSLIYILIMLALRRYRAFQAIPYGPFLVAGAGMVLFTPELAQTLLRLLGPFFTVAP